MRSCLRFVKNGFVAKKYQSHKDFQISQNQEFGQVICENTCVQFPIIQSKAWLLGFKHSTNKVLVIMQTSVENSGEQRQICQQIPEKDQSQAQAGERDVFSIKDLKLN